MSMKNPLTPAGIEPATFRFVAQHINHCATAVPSHQCRLPWIWKLLVSSETSAGICHPTQPLTEMSTRSISCGKGGRYARLTTYHHPCAVVTKFGNLNFLEPSGSVQALPTLMVQATGPPERSETYGFTSNYTIISIVIRISYLTH